MALIEAGANPDMFNSKEKYYILFVIGMVAIGLASGGMIGFGISRLTNIPDRHIIYMSCMLFFGGSSLLVAFFTIVKWLNKQK